MNPGARLLSRVLFVATIAYASGLDCYECVSISGDCNQGKCSGNVCTANIVDMTATGGQKRVVKGCADQSALPHDGCIKVVNEGVVSSSCYCKSSALCNDEAKVTALIAQTDAFSAPAGPDPVSPDSVTVPGAILPPSPPPRIPASAAGNVTTTAAGNVTTAAGTTPVPGGKPAARRRCKCNTRQCQTDSCEGRFCIWEKTAGPQGVVPAAEPKFYCAEEVPAGAKDKDCAGPVCFCNDADLCNQQGASGVRTSAGAQGAGASTRSAAGAVRGVSAVLVLVVSSAVAKLF